ncbi:MAG TPA: 50S ribosomal protein L29 [Candidatus Saccharimonadales bacterium]|nr:50S ribosomal protein L29 [Candidatus Saccharimonadales bacterium]
MKSIDFLKDHRSLTPKEISARITDSHKQLTRLEQDRQLGKLKNVHEITFLRKNIARLQTLLDEKVSERVSENVS